MESSKTYKWLPITQGCLNPGDIIRDKRSEGYFCVITSESKCLQLVPKGVQEEQTWHYSALIHYFEYLPLSAPEEDLGVF